jgi:hypothetical protein
VAAWITKRFDTPKARTIRAFFHLERAGQRRMRAIAQMPESAHLRGGWLFASPVGIICTIEAPVPVRAEDGLDPPCLHGGWHG